ncbi:MAG TPA: alpha-amylase family glycosyl hydrolase [Bacteroidales bacterium]|nr:alpha-amylase family glycosyl hydrolase [Bacteroidales bacterium]
MTKKILIFPLLAAYFVILSCNLPEEQKSTATEHQKIVQYGTPYNKVPDPRDASIYQINIRAFSDEGNFKGIIPRLDSIKDLGVNLIYLMPIYPVGKFKSVNSPYCISDYLSVNPEFGTLDDLRELVNGAHERGMAVILDWVANHTSWDNLWMKDKSWYLQDSNGNIISPPGHNWNDVAQLDFKNNTMRQAMINAMKYWVLTANVDGFRCDYSDGPPFDFWKQAIDTLRNNTGHKLIMLSEGSRNDHFAAGFDYNFGFRTFETLKRIYKSNRPVSLIDSLNVSEYRGASDMQRVVRYTSNHDVNGSDGTPLELFGGERGAIAAFVAAAYMKSVPMIYNGQEVNTTYRLTFPFTSQNIRWSINPAITKEYKRIIGFRNESEAIRRGQLTSFSNQDICAFLKELGNEKIFVLVNMRNQIIDFSLNQKMSETSWTDVMTGQKTSLGKSISLQPYTYLILKKDKY